MSLIKQKIYCYVDESGQDSKSREFIAVAIIVPRKMRETGQRQLINLEKSMKTFGLKWHKTKLDRALNYLKAVVDQKIAKGQTYIGYFKKPTPYFFPIVDTIENAIKETMQNNKAYQATIYIDGNDKKKSLEVTNVLRSHGIRLHRVRSARDESEPMIRLADMWAGCARSATLGNKQSHKQIITAQKRDISLL